MSVRQVRHRDTRRWNRARVGLTAKPIICREAKMVDKERERDGERQHLVLTGEPR